MKLCRFQDANGEPSPGLLLDQSIMDLRPAGVRELTQLLESHDLVSEVQALGCENLPQLPLAQTPVLAPIDRQEIWAAGVTYLRSKKARMEESNFSATAYDRVYDAARPELFFKSLPEKVAGPADYVGIRSDARWSVPEPELALVLNSRGELAGYTLGNDMSARDIEGENLLYLPQAKIFRNSCALGPCVRVGAAEPEAREWRIALAILRNGAEVFTGQTSVSNIKRSFAELAAFLFRSQDFPRGAVLLTGTGIVPPDDFTLAPGDTVRIECDGIGLLQNAVEEV